MKVFAVSVSVLPTATHILDPDEDLDPDKDLDPGKDSNLEEDSDQD